MVLGKLPVPGRPTIWITVGQGPTALAVGAGGGCLDIFTLTYPFFPLSPSLWKTARYRLKYCLKGPLNPKPINQPNLTGSNLFPIRSKSYIHSTPFHSAPFHVLNSVHTKTPPMFSSGLVDSLKRVQQKFNGSNTDGSFTTTISNLFFYHNCRY